ncbi:MAG: hypothetical protein EBZ48_00860 [Proteobacteria bacterium]|nr:hypothetical protein [Pseudomonadota bacterium]
MKQLLQTFIRMRGPRALGRSQVLALVPGLLLISLGVAAVLAPQIIAALVAVFLLYLGGIALFLGWKIIQMRRRMQEMLKGLAERVQVVSINPMPFEVAQSGAQGMEEGFTSELNALEISDESLSHEGDPDDGSERPEIRKIIVH